MRRRTCPSGRSALGTSLALVLAGCFGSPQSGKRAPTAHERYGDRLRSLGLHQRELGRVWFEAGERALSSPVECPLPYHEVFFLDPATPSAVAYRFRLLRGQRLEATLERPTPEPGDPPKLFLELHRLTLNADGGTHRTLVDSHDALEPFVTEARADGDYVLRIQPELLSGGRHTITLRAGASIAFPVEGKDSRAVKSFFGDSRDGGRRSHEGVDIFAPKGTHALAAGSGFVVRVSEGGLGGRVVWMKDSDRGHYYYYAHLDEQLVTRGLRVEAGAVLGTIGNTGNARTTPPHLHFGVYRAGALDPLPFLHEPTEKPAELRADPAPLGAWARVEGPLVYFRSGPSTATDPIDRLPRLTPMKLEAAADHWYRARLPDGRTGWISASLVRLADAPTETLSLPTPKLLARQPGRARTAIAELESDTRLGVLARFGDDLYVDTPKGRGWVRTLASL